ncbi:MAG: helix-turn-helix domain-containing protein [Candidatus Omnitrophica bacterium]|nr:helix-turn-helix domain-containing protein [Candidatus Omnitrophota bacterium]
MDKVLLSIQELSEHLKVSTNTIYSWVSQKRIPHIKVGRLVRFEKGKINEWLESRSVEVYSKY